MIHTTRYRLFDANIASEHFGEEAVVVNLMTGVYYSMPGVASHIWSRILEGYSVAEIRQDLIQAYVPETEEEKLHAELEDFVQSLLVHELIVADETVSRQTDTDAIPEGEAYTTPALEVFQDMKEILLLDPVHDVNSLGWPTRISGPENP
jgi:hypothetical protein